MATYAVGPTAPPPRPWTNRASTRIGIDGARPPMTRPAPNSTSPAVNGRWSGIRSSAPPASTTPSEIAEEERRVDPAVELEVAELVRDDRHHGADGERLEGDEGDRRDEPDRETAQPGREQVRGARGDRVGGNGLGHGPMMPEVVRTALGQLSCRLPVDDFALRGPNRVARPNSASVSLRQSTDRPLVAQPGVRFSAPSSPGVDGVDSTAVNPGWDRAATAPDEATQPANAAPRSTNAGCAPRDVARQLDLVAPGSTPGEALHDRGERRRRRRS